MPWFSFFRQFSPLELLQEVKVTIVALQRVEEELEENLKLPVWEKTYPKWINTSQCPNNTYVIFFSERMRERAYGWAVEKGLFKVITAAVHKHPGCHFFHHEKDSFAFWALSQQGHLLQCRSSPQLGSCWTSPCHAKFLQNCNVKPKLNKFTL